MYHNHFGSRTYICGFNFLPSPLTNFMLYFFFGYLFPSSTLPRLLTEWSRSSVELEGFNIYLDCFKSFHLACWDPCSTNIFSLPFCCFKYGAFISSSMSMNYHGCSCSSDGNPFEQLLHKFQHQKKNSYSCHFSCVLAVKQM